MSDHAAIIVRRGKEILFVRRSMQKRILPGAWAFPSGTRKPNETIFETAKREVQEELGIRVNTDEILCEKDLPEFGDKLSFVLCSITSGEPQICEPKEMDSLKWMPFKEFLDQHDDSQIGHGLVYLRTQPQLCAKLN